MVGGMEWKGERDKTKMTEGEREERKGKGREGRKRGSRRNESLWVKKKEEMQAAKTDHHNCNVIWERDKRNEGRKL